MISAHQYISSGASRLSGRCENGFHGNHLDRNDATDYYCFRGNNLPRSEEIIPISVWVL
jgi:hypothetical protein